ncbi:hypothetical protein WJX84_010484 [Apatococcus fuscideae]|uniref:Acetyl-CoA carboxylase n=1 Tax=Apatococcus fuscideae TaxID=2026836 RepID=A0AAW1TDE2_9CHLO
MYLQRIYHNFISQGPLASQHYSQQGMCHAIVVHHFPVTLDGRSGGDTFLSAAIAVASMDLLATAMEAVDKQLVKLGLEEVTKCTLHVMMHESAATTTLTAAADKMQGKEYSFAPGSKEFQQTEADGPGRTLARASSQANPGIFEAMASSGFKFLSVLTADQHALSSHVVFARDNKTNASDLVQSAHCASWTGDPSFGHVEPFSGALLELARLSGLAQNMSCLKIMRPQIMLFTMLEKEGRVQVRRLFIRRVVRDIKCLSADAIKSQSRQVMASTVMAELADLLIASLDSFKTSRANQSFNEPADWTHIFLACIPLLPITDPADQQRMTAALKHAARQQMMKHRSELRQAAVGEWEIVIRAADSSCIWRLEVNQDQAYAHNSKCVRVTYEAGDTERVIGEPAYQLLGKIEHKRAVARRQSTTYCHDFINVFEDALELAWAAHPPQIGAPSLSTIGTPVLSEELVLEDPAVCSSEARLKMVQRPIGENDIGIVAWVLTLHSPECPTGRKVVAIANDITMGAGAFGPKEYAMFAAAANYGLAHRMPILYLAANSGARFGLAQEVEWQDPADPNKGIKYLYLTDADYQQLMNDSSKRQNAFKASPITSAKGHKQWVVSDIIGGEDGLGVECLSGSGAIASAYSKAFEEGLTMTVVSGRTVGIGAYLARLGRRCIQRSDQPIILTGYTALNKLLGRRVYKSNHQLGGPQVLGFNGVSHLVVDDDLQAAQATLRWLSYLPINVGDPTRCLPCPDPVDRAIEYSPSEGAKIDPRAALTGRLTGEGWQSGLMDQGSWLEMQRDWARTVIVGRARLGGCPVGVIAAESETQTVTVPADPAIPGSAEATVSQAGQVWYPDSALKTAHAIEEMNKEGLPLVILANWRGFSGGQRDLLDGILQAGSLIVEELRKYRYPVLVYLPPGSELRGGAWVVIDSQINTAAIEMFADPTATDRAPSVGTSKKISAREKALMPAYQQVAVAFAGMHDTPVRMIAKGVVKDIVHWQDARRVLATRLRRRLAENAWAQKLEEASENLTHRAALDHVRRVAAKHVEHVDANDKGVSWEIDAFFVEWANSEAATQVFQDLLMEISTQEIDRQVQRMLASAGGRAGLLQLLHKNMKQDEGLREGVQQLL